MAPGAATMIRTVSLRRLFAATAVMLCLAPGAQGADRARIGPMELGRVVPPPSGAGALCRELPWACDGTQATAPPAAAEVLRLAEGINRAINRRYAAMSDRRRFGREDHWAVLGPRGGDCEDFALSKMQALLAAGVAPRDLRVATVLDADRQPHAVLVVSVDDEDLVLDNLTDQILPWNATGYVFLRMQDRDDGRLWRIVRGAHSLASL